MPAELQIKGNYTWSQQLGIAIAKLSDSDRLDLITWVKDVSADLRLIPAGPH